MADYFLVHEQAIFEQQLRPLLAAAWRERSFDPCIELCRTWTAAVKDQAARYHIKAEDIALLHIERGLLFDRAIWRTLVGEFLLFAARDVPEFPTKLDSLLSLFGPSGSVQDNARTDLSPIQQTLHGSRDLTFGTAIYRPEHAGYNNSKDVARLAEYLASVRPDTWMMSDLAGSLEGEEGEDELAFAREWFAVLRDLYCRAAGAGQVLILERIF